MSGPIKPSEVVDKKRKQLPDGVFDAFNELIAERWDGRSAVVLVGDAAIRIAAKLKIERSAVFDRGLLDVDDIYRKAGWRVEYDKPGYCETYEAKFTFRKGTR